ncbi:hypothetical protein CfE428DRAFT_4327 [Chthoniobacter flavus Ellin428]|uniref:Autotransporter-associated beta strand repeat protein n=1 Tax=Chthoniobacter flavus Ellin428 TaxID=497964 RepID=B4D5Y8_9BACT|nr:PEP-CTERM sorting domain-containing protein [Chthoniobacter flavus]EDY18191.1 hypothetical protein CfE428DRAFT_4327 [Chthoniobacter flavus Ellin428]TCO91456.1 putative secreted protein with PEP-CTERM sorting signal [Chthoniobacter flavus]
MKVFPSVVVGCVLTWSAAVLSAQAQDVSGGGATLIMYSGHSTGMLSVNGSTYLPYTGGDIAGVNTVTVFNAAQDGTLQNVGSLEKTGIGNLSFATNTFSGATLDTGLTLNNSARFVGNNNISLAAGSTFSVGGTLVLNSGSFYTGSTVITNAGSVLNSRVPILLGANSTLTSNGVLNLTVGSLLNSGGTVSAGVNSTLAGGLLTFGNGGSITTTGTVTSAVNLSGGSILTSIVPTLNLNGSLDTGATFTTSGATLSLGINNVGINNVAAGTISIVGTAPLIRGGSGILTLAGGIGTINPATGSILTVNPVIGAGSLSAFQINNTSTLNLTTGGIPQANLITLNGSSTLNLNLPATTLLSKLPPIKNGVAGSNGTTVTFLGGAVTNASTVSLLFLPAAQNLVSDPLSLNITETPAANDKYVLEMSYNPSLVTDPSKLYLAWLDTSDSTWKNAVNGDSDAGASHQFVSGAYDAANDFNLGEYGVDAADSTVWAVIDHSGEFGVAESTTPSLTTQSIRLSSQSISFTPQFIPEPSSIALLLCGVALFGRRSRRK